MQYAVDLLKTAVLKGILQKETAVNILNIYKQNISKRNYRSIEGLLIENNVPFQTVTKIHALLPQSGNTSNEAIKGYRIMDKIGIGGMSTVFKAMNPFGKIIALKILYPTKVTEGSITKFFNEAKLLTRFDHENLIKGLDFGTYNNLCYFSMEFADGESLQDLIDKKNQLDENIALEMILEITKGLEYIQKMGYVHKDIKPANILITKLRKIKLCDLGFAEKIGHRKSDQEYTEGTVQFMSPEQIQGQADLDIRSDIYSLGVTLYFIIMGKLPFEGASDVETMAKHVYEEINSAELKNKRISNLMHYFIHRMTSKEKEERFQSPSDLITQLTEHTKGYNELFFKKDEAKQTSIIRGLSKPAPTPLPSKKTTKPTTSLRQFKYRRK
ncbi:MAG: serine/threonine protein kinase [Planctomycetes bacterium]|nr:serine/threonine protein kinase [Planctomycetota bacterium]